MSLFSPPALLRLQAKILVVRDIERDDIAFLAKALALRPIAHPDHLTPDKLGSAALVEEVVRARPAREACSRSCRTR